MNHLLTRSTGVRCANLAVAAAVALAFGLSACGKKEEAPSGTPSAASPSPAPVTPASSSAPSTAPGAASAPAGSASSSSFGPTAPDANPEEKKLANAKPMASTTASDARLDTLFTGWNMNNWRSEKQGPAAKGEWVGFELPEGTTLQPRELTVRWVAWHWVPSKLAVEYSDDGKKWTEAGAFQPKEPADVKSHMNGVNRWDETFNLPASAGGHRFWRLRAVDVPESNYFGLERISVK